MSIKTIPININNQEPLDETQLRKMKFILNALEKGWSVKKKNDSYIFTKKHEGKREIMMDRYLEQFLAENFMDR